MKRTDKHAASCGSKHVALTDGVEYCPVSCGLIVWVGRLGMPADLLPRDRGDAKMAAAGALAACRQVGFQGPVETVLVCVPKADNSREGTVYVCDGDL